MKRQSNGLSKKAIRFPPWRFWKIIGSGIFAYLNAGNLDLVIYMGFGKRLGYKSQL